MKKEGTISNFYTRNGTIFARKNKDMKYVKIQAGMSKTITEELVNGAQKIEQPIRQTGQQEQTPVRQGTSGSHDSRPPTTQTVHAQQRMKTRSASVVEGGGKL